MKDPDKQEKEVGVATKLVKEEARQKGEQVVFGCADPVRAEPLETVGLVVVKEDGAWGRGGAVLALPEHEVALEGLPRGSGHMVYTATRPTASIVTRTRHTQGLS